MHGGALDRIITIKEQTRSRDANSGQTILSFTEVDTRRAHVKPAFFDEQVREEQNRKIAKESYIFTIRYYTGLTVSHVIEYDNRNFNIVGLAEIGRKRWWRIHAEHKV